MDTVERSAVTAVEQVYDGFISYSHAADDLLAPRLQSALQRFAKPWWKRRAVRIFRDESSLSANPHLWSSITEALDTSGWFVLLLSPDAADSEWVNQEIEYWTTHRDPDRILPVVTDGDFGWHDGNVEGDAVPQALQGVFTEEPRWVDLRWAKGETQLDLKNPRFADAIADIASTIREVPKDDLASEEVKQHRRTVRTAWTAGALVTVLAIAAAGFGIQSANNANEAERQAEIAEQNAEQAQINADEADANAEEALLQRQEAESQAELARTQAAIAKARELAASSVNAAKEDPQLGILLGVQAVDSLPAGESVGPALEAALRGALSADRLLGRYEERATASHTSLDVSADGSLIALSVLESAVLEVVDSESLEPLWRYTENPPDRLEWVAFSSEGSRVVLSVADERFSLHDAGEGVGAEGEADARFLVFDARNGDLLHTEVFPGACAVNVMPGSWREDLNLMGVGFVGCGSDGEFEGTIRFFDTETWETVFERTAADRPHVVFGGSGTLAALLTGATSEPATAIVDTATWEVLRSEIVGPFGALSPDGEILAVDVGMGARIENARSGELIDRISTGSFFIGTIRFSDRGDLLLDVIGDETVVIDPSSGAEVSRLQTGRASGGAVLVGGKLFTASDGVVQVWDQAGLLQGDLNTIPLGKWVNSNSIFQAADTAVAHVYDFETETWSLYPIELSGLLAAPIDVNDVWEMTPIPGNRMFIQRFEQTEEALRAGPFEVLDLASGASEVVGGCWMPAEAAALHEPCPGGEPHPSGIIALVGSRSGDEVMVFDELQRGESRNTWVSIWDTETMTVTSRLDLGLLDAWGNQMRDSAITEDYLVLFNRRTGSIEVRDRHTSASMSIEGPIVSASRLEHDPVSNALWLTDGRDRVFRLDLDRLVIEPVSEEGTPGFARGIAPSPGGDRVAVGSTDGALRIYSKQGELLHLIPLPNPSDAYWLDDSHLAVGTALGPWTTITLDPDELAEVARTRLRRSFSATECQFFAIDPCPTLEQMQSR